MNLKSRKDMSTKITHPSYSTVFSKTSPVEVAELFGKVGKGGGVNPGTKTMGAGIINRKMIAGLPTMPMDVSKGAVVENLAGAAKRTDGGIRAHAVGPYARAHSIVAQLLEEPLVFPNGRVPSLSGTPEQRKEFALRFLEENFDPEIRQKLQRKMLVVEALPENLKLKKQVLEFLAYVLPEDAIIATNTSSLSIDEIAEPIPNPERVLGIHYFNPADQNEGAEVIRGSKTSDKHFATAYYLLKAEGLKPIMVFKDKPLAVGNRIFVAVLRKAQELAEKGLASRRQIDKIYLQTFYGDQIGVQFQKAKDGFKKAIKLDFFDDEAEIYKKVSEIEKEIEALTFKGKIQERDKLTDEKVKLLKEAADSLGQTFLYAGILENASVLGSAFETPELVEFIKKEAGEKLNTINQYLNATKYVPANKLKSVKEITGKELTPYVIPDIPDKNLTKAEKQYIADQLEGIFIAAADQIRKEGLATPSDIDLLVRTAFEYNTAPFSLAKELGENEVKRLITLVNQDLPAGGETGIAKPENYTEPTSKDLSGVQTYIQGDTATIEIGFNQIQFLKNTSNSLTPEMLIAIKDFIKEFEANPNIKAIFIESKDGKVFGSGASLKYVDENKKKVDKVVDYAEFGYKVIAKIIKNCSKPVIGIADGIAVGGSLELLAACRRRYGSEGAAIQLPEKKKLRLVPLWGGTENIPELIGKELAIPFECESKLMSADKACRAGFYDNPNKKPFLRNELYQFKLDLIAGKVPGIDIRNLEPRQPEFNKRIEDYDIRKEFGLGRLDKKPHYTHKGLNVKTRDSGVLIKQLIEHADDPSYRERRITREKLGEIARGALDYSAQTIKPQLWIAKNKYAARTVEVLTGVMIKLGKFKKALLG